MKKLYNLFAFSVLAVAAVFTSCKPLDKTFDELGPKPIATAPPTNVSAVITLGASDYALLPSSNAAKAAQSFADSSSALSSIPTILAAKYPNTADKSTASVTFSFTPPAAFTATDNLITDISYTATDDDYTTELGANYSYKEFSTAQAEDLLSKKGYNKEGGEVILTYIFYESGVTSKATTVTDTFIYLNGAWIKGYTLTAAQFALVGNTFGDFSSSDDANIPAYLSAILSADLGFTAKAKPGQVVYVAYKYYVSSTKQNQQHITALVYDGNSHRWVNSLPSATFAFNYSSSTKAWASSISGATNYTLVSADYTAIAGYTDLGATAAAQANLKQYLDFSTSGATAWTDDQITAGIAELLKTKYPAASKGQTFVVTYEVYSGGPKDLTKTYTYDGSKFMSGSGTSTGNSYALIAADYTAISKLTTTGASAAALSNLGQYGDFSTSGSTAWTNVQIYAGIATILKQDYPSATANQILAVTYEIYSGGATDVTVNFKYDGSNWTAQP